MSTAPRTATLAAAGLSGHLDPAGAAEQVCEQALSAGLARGEASIACLFASGAHAEQLPRIAEVARARIGPKALVGVSAEGVLGGESELEDQTGVSLLALRAPGATVRPFTYDDLPAMRDADDAASIERLARAMRAGSDLRAVLLFADPFSVPMGSLLPAMTRAGAFAARNRRRPPIIGGMASAASTAGDNRLVVNDRVMNSGAVGVSIHGDVAVDCVVSQGCRPVGEPMVITGARRNIITSLAGRRALDVVKETIAELSTDDRNLLADGLLIGRAVTEYKDRFGRGDFLIRSVLGADPNQGAIAVGDLAKVGQTVQLHVRDARTASEDLAMMLDAQRLHDPPAGAVVVTCNGRGTELFDVPNHDASMISGALAGDGAFPLAGFFGAGEIGPVGDASFLHGHTVCAALFRDPAKTPGVG